MKKFLSILVAVAMAFSLFAGAFAPRASAASTLLTDSGKIVDLEYFSTLPSATEPVDNVSVLTTVADQYVYNMGDVIHGTVKFDTVAAGNPYTVELIAWEGAWTEVLDSVVAYQVAGVLTYPFQIGTGNVTYDGPYMVRVTEGGAGAEEPVEKQVFIKYNLTWKVKTIANCSGSVTLEGWITRGNFMAPSQPVIVAIQYPDKDDGIGYVRDEKVAAAYFVTTTGSGQFSLTFQVRVVGDVTLDDMGKFKVYVRDAYPDAVYPPVEANMTSSAYTTYLTTGVGALAPDNDAMVYDTLSNIPTNLAITAATFGSPILLYKNTTGQPIVLSLMDQNGDPVVGATPTVTDATATSWAEISPGYYRFVLDIGAPANGDVRFYFTKNIFGTTKTSNTVIINLRDRGPFNPYLDINAGKPVRDCDAGRLVDQKLPCTIGNALTISVGYWPVADPCNWRIADDDTDVNGPVRSVGGGVYVIEKAGKITASISMTVWERIDQKCPVWCEGYISESDMAANACCHTYEKNFDICEVASCSLVSVTLENGAQTDATTIEVGKKADLVVNVSGQNAPAGLSCGCNTKLVHIYMVDDCKGPVAGAFTLDTYSGLTTTVSELWYNGTVAVPRPMGETTDPTTTTPDDTWNPQYYDAAGGEYGTAGSVTFQATTPNAIIVDNCEKLTFKGVTFNLPTDTPCNYTLVVQVFGLERWFDCGNMFLDYPFISETIDDIDINPKTTTLTFTGDIFEGAVDPSEALAGVTGTYIVTTDPGFTLDGVRGWDVTLNGVSLTKTVSTTDDGWKFTFPCAFDEAGDLEIYGYAYSEDCLELEEAVLLKKVVMPVFEVKIGLLDGSIIANDNIITEGFAEDIYVTATDPRVDGHHDFSTDPNWDLEVYGTLNDCDLPVSIACGTTPLGCTTPSPITVSGYDNPHLEDSPDIELYFVVGDCAKLYVDTFTLVKPTVGVTPTEVPFTIPASATHVVFNVKDAHAHGAPNVAVTIEGTTNSSGASGYSFVAGSAVTDATGEANWAFVPPYSGKYFVSALMAEDLCPVPCSWSGSVSTTASITAKYQAPVVDTTAPVVTLAAGLDGSTVEASTLSLTGKVTDNVGVTQLFVGFNKVDVLPDGSFMTALKLVEGENTITVVAYDAAGNKGTATAKVTYKAPVDTSITLVLTIGTDVVSVNGKATSIDAAPEIVAGRTFVPIRFISESFGATVEWLAETQGITITLGDATIGLQIGNATAVIDGNIVSLPAAPYIKNGRTMVPLRVISEAFGGDVVWEPTTRTITITYVP